MNIENLVRSARALWRAEAIIAQLRLQDFLTRFGLRALAALVASFGLLMLELAAYFAMVQIWSAVTAALLLSAVNFLFAIIIVVFSTHKKSDKEHELASELQKSALEVLQADAANLQEEFRSYKRAFSHPLDSNLATLAVPAASLLIKALRKARETHAAK